MSNDFRGAKIQVLSNDNAGKNKSYEKTNSEIFVEFVSIPQKLHSFKNPHRLPTEPMGIHQSPYPYQTHTHGNPHGNTHTHGSPATTCSMSSLPLFACHVVVSCCRSFSSGYAAVTCITRVTTVRVLQVR